MMITASMIRIMAVSWFASVSSIALQANAAESPRYVMHVLSDRTLEGAISRYQKLFQNLPKEKRSRLEPFAHQVNLGAKGLWYRLRLGPLMPRQEALSLCRELKAGGHDYCEVHDAFALAQVKGGFYGELWLKPLDDGRNMEVVKPVGFVDSEARKWEVPIKSITDGASIPRVLWSLIGSPFTGHYRRAAVLHDYYSVTKRRSWRDTHNLFYEAMIKDGVDPKQALLMWATVYRFGPRWTRGESSCWNMCACTYALFEDVTFWPHYSEIEFSKINSLINGQGELTRDQVEDFVLSKTFDTEYGARMEGVVTMGTCGGGTPDLPRIKHNMEAPSLTWRGLGDGKKVQITKADYSFVVAPIKNGEVEYIGKELVTLRSGAGDAFSVSHRLERTGVVTLKDCSGEWCRVRVGSAEGWVKSEELVYRFPIESEAIVGR